MPRIYMNSFCFGIPCLSAKTMHRKKMVLTHLFQIFSLFEASSVSHGYSGAGKLTEGFRNIANLLDSIFAHGLCWLPVCASLSTPTGGTHVWWQFSIHFAYQEVTHLLQENKYIRRPIVSCFSLYVEVFCPVAKLPLLKDPTSGDGSDFRTSNQHPTHDLLCSLIRVCGGLKKVDRCRENPECLRDKYH